MNERRNDAWVLALFLVPALATAACTTSKALPPDEPRTTPSPASTTGAGQPELTLQTQTATPGSPWAFGAPCKADDTVHCGTKGRVAVLVEMRNGAPSKWSGAPCELLNLSQEEFAAEPGHGCVKDEHVYLTASCEMCRQFSEWDMIGLVAEMTDLQLVTAQKRVGLSPAPVLRTTEGWRTAIATAAAKAPKRRR